MTEGVHLEVTRHNADIRALGEEVGEKYRADLERRADELVILPRSSMGSYHLSRTDGGARSLVGQLDYELNST
jgi:hypothetical protein